MQDFIKAVERIANGPSLQFSDILLDLVTLPQFFLPMFGFNDRDVYSKFASIFINASPGYAV